MKEGSNRATKRPRAGRDLRTRGKMRHKQTYQAKRKMAAKAEERRAKMLLVAMAAAALLLPHWLAVG